MALTGKRNRIRCKFPRRRRAACWLSAAIYSQISVMSCAARGWKGEPLSCGHCGECFLSNSFFAPPKHFKKFLAVDGLRPAAFRVVIAAVEHFPRLEKLVKVPATASWDKLVRASSALRGEVLELPFHLGREVYFDALKIREKRLSRKAP